MPCIDSVVWRLLLYCWLFTEEQSAEVADNSQHFIYVKIDSIPSELIVYYYQVTGKRSGLSQRRKLQQQSSRKFRENIVNDRRNLRVIIIYCPVNSYFLPIIYLMKTCHMKK